jgi:hypothetical protein
LHNLIDGTDIYQALITDQTAMTSVGSLDKLLIADSDLTAADAPRSVTVNELFEDALTLSTYTNVQATNSFYTNATGNYTRSTGATITNGTIVNLTSSTGSITIGTIPTLTAGTTTSTAANITNGTVQTLTASTANISQGSAILTQGTIATLNSTTGTIANLFATTSTFLGTITGSTNVVDIGSGQLYKDASGNIGIGITTGTSKLNIYGTAAAAGPTWAGGSDIVLLNNNGAYSEQAIAFQEGGFAVGAKIGVKNTGLAAYDIILANRANTSATSSITEKFRIASLGQIGIGGANYGTSGQVLTSAGASAAPSWQTVSAITSGTAVASTSGTAIDFTGIPSGVKKITVMLSAVATNGTGIPQVQLGTSGGVVSSGYASSAGVIQGPTSVSILSSTAGFVTTDAGSATQTLSGNMIITNLTSNTWVASFSIYGQASAARAHFGGGTIALGGTLDRIRITTNNSTGTFNAGTVNILYES